jgi:hypothetical protein
MYLSRDLQCAALSLFLKVCKVAKKAQVLLASVIITVGGISQCNGSWHVTWDPVLIQPQKMAAFDVDLLEVS